jgi:hypothetical protein
MEKGVRTVKLVKEGSLMRKVQIENDLEGRRRRWYRKDEGA